MKLLNIINKKSKNRIVPLCACESIRKRIFEEKKYYYTKVSKLFFLFLKNI